MPKGYIAAEVIVEDWNGYDQYRAQVLQTVQAYGGRFLVRGGDPKLVEGDEPLGRAVILEFESPERAMEWYDSPEYQRIAPLRKASTKTRVLCMVGAE